MTIKTPKKETKQPNKSGVEKPVSLWGASPMPKEVTKKKSEKNV